ncbi:MAG: histidine phosphatase family protein [Betaproteobacteria bacterium]
MDLILWRHADAREVRDGETDHDRPLTAKGERQAAKMARWLNLHLPDTARVLVSPTLRTAQTAQGLERRKRVIDALKPEDTVEALLHAARWPDAKEAVVVVGHQPTLGLTAAYLLAGVTQPWPVRKGALWWIKRREREGQVEILLHASLTAEHV